MSEPRLPYQVQDLKSRIGTPLTPREEQTVALVAQGKPNKEIAYEMGISYGTVKEYLVRAFARTGATNRTELALWYLQQRPVGSSEVAHA